MKTASLTILVSLVTWIGLAATTRAAESPPNIVLILSDDQGWNDVSAYGSEIPTPNMDRLAADGVKFTQFYSASAICTPSRFGLLTGTNPSRSHDRLLGALMFMAEEDRDRGIRPDERTLGEVLRDEAGYETALIGKWHLGHGDPSFLPPNHGFDFFRGHTGGCIDYFTMTYGKIPDWHHGLDIVNENGYATELIGDEAVNYLESKAGSTSPFFLYLPYNAPHFGKGYSPKDDAPVNIMQPQAADLKRVASIEDKVRREFAAMTVSLDDAIGRVLETLDRTGLSDNTLVIFLTDHGGDPVYGGRNLPLRDGKATLFDGGLRVPCLMRWPGKITAGSVIESPVWSIDLFPTLCHLAGAPTDGLALDGIDLSPALRGEATLPTDRDFFWELGAHAELERKHWAALRSGNLKYVNSPKDGEFLFDLAADPNEQNDLAGAQPERLAEMRKRWETLAATYREASER
ncbi:MAG: sulfatase-like hydrolase/transferase [Verrucomicrobiae bacterium]|nr:sulfatase-like hydrolase/transferase [Verrucomicrobiae bacterium]